MRILPTGKRPPKRAGSSRVTEFVAGLVPESASAPASGLGLVPESASVQDLVLVPELASESELVSVSELVSDAELAWASEWSWCRMRSWRRRRSRLRLRMRPDLSSQSALHLWKCPEYSTASGPPSFGRERAHRKHSQSQSDQRACRHGAFHLRSPWLKLTRSAKLHHGTRHRLCAVRYATTPGDRRHMRKEPELAPGSLSEGVRVTVVSAFHRE